MEPVDLAGSTGNVGPRIMAVNGAEDDEGCGTASGRRRKVVAHVQAVHSVSERRSCVVLCVDRSSIRYVSHRPDQTPLMLRIRDLAATRTRYSYFRIYILLRREGWFVNHNRVYRL